MPTHLSLREQRSPAPQDVNSVTAYANNDSRPPQDVNSVTAYVNMLWIDFPGLNHTL